MTEWEDRNDYNRDRRMRDNHKYGSQEEQNNDEFMIK